MAAITYSTGSLPSDALPQRLAEADREAQHADAEAARDPEMTELVHRDQHADRHDERGER